MLWDWGILLKFAGMKASLRQVIARCALVCAIVMTWNVPAQAVGTLLEQEFLYTDTVIKSCHAATIACLDNGDLVTAFFGGSYEGCPDVCIYVCRKPHNASQWTRPQLVADGVINDTLRKACYNPVLTQLPSGELLLFFKIGANVADWTGWLMRSHDGGVTWSAREPLPTGYLGPIKNKPLLVGNRLLCPSSTERDGWRIHFETLDLSTGQWSKTAPIPADTAWSLQHPGQQAPIGAIQPSIITLTDGRLQALCRSQNGLLATTFSTDGGHSWERVRLMPVPNNCSGTDAVTIAPGLHALVYNPVRSYWGDYHDPRTPLDVALSHDGWHWDKLLTLEDAADGEFSYPSVIAAPDGTLHIVYTWRRQRIVYAHVGVQ